MNHAGHDNRLYLFVVSCISLCVTSMIFVIRGDIEAALSTDFHLTKEQMGHIWGPAFWGFTIAIFVCGAVVDKLGLKFMHALSAVGFSLGLCLILFAPQPEMADGDKLAGIFDSTGSTMLYAGFLMMGLSQGVVEGVINPLIITLYPDRKAHKLNVLHAFWPMGMVIGGIAALLLSKLGVSWQVKLGIIFLPTITYLVMCLRKTYPVTERVQANIPTGDMFKACLHPLFILLWCCMWLTAATELAPDQWFPTIMDQLTGLQGTMFLVYTAGLMFVIRFFFGGIVHTYSPFLVLAICSVIVFVGLFWLGNLAQGGSAFTAFAAATLFGIGKTFFWPTMLGIISERFPRSGALGINLMGGSGMLAIAVALPIMGAKLDTQGPGAALHLVSYLAIVLVVIFTVLYMYFRSKGGYKAESIHD
jgi:MFS family permease